MPARSATKTQPSSWEEKRTKVVGASVLSEVTAALGEESSSDQVPESVGEDRSSDDGWDVPIKNQAA